MEREKVTINGVPCPICGYSHSVEVFEDDFQKYSRGNGLIQDCFPYLSKQEREILITGINGECWNKLF